MTEQSDYLVIERVLYGLWAPRDGDPQQVVGVADDDEPVTVNDVYRARRALERIKERRSK